MSLAPASKPPDPTPAVERVKSGSTLHLIDTFRPNGKQAKFFRTAWSPLYDEILLHGAIRSGKSQSCGKMLLAWAMRYGGTYVVCRGTYKELEDSTKTMMLKGEGGLPPVIPPELYDPAYGGQIYHGDKNKVVLVNGAEIRFRSLEPQNRGKIRNITYSGGFIDQIEELDGEGDEEFYEEFMGRLSDPYGPRKMLSAANPGPEDHWVCRRFGCTADTLPYRKPRTASIHVTMLDNAHNLDPNYVAGRMATKDTNPDYYLRMVLGEWGAFGGKRFKGFRRQQTLYPGDFDVLPSGWEVIEGADYGWSNPTHWVWIAIDYEGRWWLLHELRVSETSISDIARCVKAIRTNNPDDPNLPNRIDGFSLPPFQGSLSPSVTFLDPSAFAKRSEHESIAQEFREQGIFPAPAQNDRLGGWARLDEYLTTVMADGYSKLRILPHVTEVVREIPSARIKPGTDDIEKVNDHGLDATRYAVMSRTPNPLEDKVQSEEHDRASVARRIVERATGRASQNPSKLYTGEN